MKTELSRIADLLEGYQDGNRWEIVKAEKIGFYENEPDGWQLTIKPKKAEMEAGDESN